MVKHSIPMNHFAVAMAQSRCQSGALCWRMRRDQIEVLLITSRDTGRWVIPKGWPIQGLCAAEVAAQEAWEEAGVEGRLEDRSTGSYTYDKVLNPGVSVACDVTVFPLRVARLAAKFPERHERRRKWFRIEKAARKVMEADLRRLLLGFTPEVAGFDSAADAAAPLTPSAAAD